LHFIGLKEKEWDWWVEDRDKVVEWDAQGKRRMRSWSAREGRRRSEPGEMVAG
jgi:hypothetical protein